MNCSRWKRKLFTLPCRHTNTANGVIISNLFSRYYVISLIEKFDPGSWRDRYPVRWYGDIGSNDDDDDDYSIKFSSLYIQ